MAPLKKRHLFGVASHLCHCGVFDSHPWNLSVTFRYQRKYHLENMLKIRTINITSPLLKFGMLHPNPVHFKKKLKQILSRELTNISPKKGGILSRWCSKLPVWWDMYPISWRVFCGSITLWCFFSIAKTRGFCLVGCLRDNKALKCVIPNFVFRKLKN